MPLDNETFNNIIAFDGKSGEAAKLNYSVPLPGSVTGRRLVELDLGLSSDDWLDQAKSKGTDMAGKIGLVKEGDRYAFDIGRATQYWLERARHAGFKLHHLKILEQNLYGSSDRPSVVTTELAKFTASATHEKTVQTFAYHLAEAAGHPPGREVDFYLQAEKLVSESGLRPSTGLPGLAPYLDDVEDDVPSLLLAEYRKYIESLYRGEILFPIPSFGGTPTSAPSPPSQARPTLLVIEVVGISSFLGDYGLGKTVRTFSLLPGESTTISLRTWKSSASSEQASSSIIDSFNRTAADRFAASLRKETTDKSTEASTEDWHAEAEVSASFEMKKVPVGAKVSGGGSGEYHSSREAFSHQAGEVVREHAKEASAGRELSVTSSSERTKAVGEEVTTEREIKNVNMRRVLNFVFRELNQEYLTKIHLKDLRIVFTNGRPGSWREVPLSGMRQLLEEVLIPKRVDETAEAVLRLLAIAYDHGDHPVTVLERVTMRTDGQGWKREPAAMVGQGPDRKYAAPTSESFYSFRRGPLNQVGPERVNDFETLAVGI
jgi:hypothetical protein